jgi:hypothetical protein
MKFSIRDLLIITAVVALAIVVGQNYNRLFYGVLNQQNTSTPQPQLKP